MLKIHAESPQSPLPHGDKTIEFRRRMVVVHFTGMFLAQIKLIGNRKIRELLDEQISVNLEAPLMEAVHLMVNHHLINLPVMKDRELVGVLRERDVILEIARSVESSG